MKQERANSTNHFNEMLGQEENGFLYDISLRSHLQAQTAASLQQIEPLEAIAAIRFACQVLSLSADRLAGRYGLSDGRMQILFLLQHEPTGELNPSTIAERLHVTPRTITGLVDALEQEQLVVRLPDPTDRRSLRIQLTDAGHDRAKILWQEAREQQQTLVRGLSSEELRQLRHLCLQIVHNTSQLS